MPSFPTAYRTLSIAYYNIRQCISKAVSAIEKAFALDPSDSRVLMELDLLYKKTGRSPQNRLHFLQQHLEQTVQRDDLYTEYITLLNMTKQSDKALQCIESHHFHPWEGGEGKISAQYVAALCMQADEKLRSGEATGCETAEEKLHLSAKPW